MYQLPELNDTIKSLLYPKYARFYFSKVRSKDLKGMKYEDIEELKRLDGKIVGLDKINGDLADIDDLAFGGNTYTEVYIGALMPAYKIGNQYVAIGDMYKNGTKVAVAGVCPGDGGKVLIKRTTPSRDDNLDFDNLWSDTSDHFFTNSELNLEKEEEEMIDLDGKKFSKSTIKEALKQYLD